jgi:hypothetical protein
LRKLDFLIYKSSLCWSDFGSITEKEQRKNGQIGHLKKGSELEELETLKKER